MIYLVRHGQTEKNRQNVLQGRSDVPLNETGALQAAAVARQLRAAGIRFERVYTSPLRRAVQTAAMLAPEVKPVTDGRLIEMDYGPYEGMDLRAPAPEVLTFFRDLAHNPAPDGMEALSSVVARMGDFLEELRFSAPHGDVLVSTHAIAMKGALEYLTPGSDGAWWPRYLGNCAVYVTELTERGFSVPCEWPEKV